MRKFRARHLSSSFLHLIISRLSIGGIRNVQFSTSKYRASTADCVMECADGTINISSFAFIKSHFYRHLLQGTLSIFSFTKILIYTMKLICAFHSRGPNQFSLFSIHRHAVKRYISIWSWKESNTKSGFKNIYLFSYYSFNNNNLCKWSEQPSNSIFHYKLITGN